VWWVIGAAAQIGPGLSWQCLADVARFQVMEAPMPTRSVRTTKLDLRLSLQAKQTLTPAARASHRSVSQFVLESALSRAEETLVERRHFELSAEQWNAFMAALDAPPRELPRLRRLFQEASPFDAAEPG
jgi:uncharacterized protein (DUF1778 family)